MGARGRFTPLQAPFTDFTEDNAQNKSAFSASVGGDYFPIFRRERSGLAMPGGRYVSLVVARRARSLGLSTVLASLICSLRTRA